MVHGGEDGTEVMVMMITMTMMMWVCVYVSAQCNGGYGFLASILL